VEWGHIVVAAVVLRDGAHVSPEELMALCRKRLAPYKVPKELRLVANLPRNAAGKLLRWELREGSS
jgi:acyl-CoA synthetase (AMP-forming)/AMP-acid ligase II